MFVVEDKYLYIHVPKTGGTYVSNVFEKLARNKNLKIEFFPENYKHIGRKGIGNLIGKNKKKYTIFSNIREPTSHYISRYNFGWWKRNTIKDQELSQIYKNFPDVTFQEFVKMINDPRFWKKNKLYNASGQQHIGASTISLLRRIAPRPLKVDNLQKNFSVIKKHIKKQKLILLKTDTLTRDLEFFLTDKLGLPERAIKDALSSEQLPKNDQRNGYNQNGGKMLKISEIGEDTKEKINYLERHLIDLIDFLKLQETSSRKSSKKD